MDNSLPAKPALQNRPMPVTEEDWANLYEHELPRILNFLRYRLGEQQLAEDLAAQTFEKAWRHRASFERNQASFITWLFTIARNNAIDHLRRQREELTLSERITTLAPSPEERVSHDLDLHRLHQALTTLSDREQEIIALKYGADLTNRQIARQIGLTAVNVGIIHFRALRKLRPFWEELT